MNKSTAGAQTVETFIVLEVVNDSLELNHKLQALPDFLKLVLRAVDDSVENDDPSEVEVSNHHGRICVRLIGAVQMFKHVILVRYNS